MNKICGIYKITNTITGDFYIGSSKDVKRRWRAHKSSSRWNEHPNYPMYIDMKQYGVDKFEFQILEEVEEASLKETEQQFIEEMQPTYNNRNADGLDTERKKEYHKVYNKEYEKSDKRKEYQKEYQKSEKYKQYQKEYHNQLCCYNGEILTLNALRIRFSRAGIENPTAEAKKYLVEQQ